MRTEAELKKQDGFRAALRETMPEMNAFRENNHAKLNAAAGAFAVALAGDEEQVAEMRDNALDCDDTDLGGVCDWILGDTDDEPYCQEDVDAFEKKAREARA